MKLLIVAGIAALMMTGCDDRYRYACQDPTNWEKQECKKPYCSADGTCPEDLSHYEKEKNEKQAISTPKVRKGECS